MAEGYANAASRLPTARPLSETSNNQVRPNTSAGFAAPGVLKRKIPNATGLQPDRKAPRSNIPGKSLINLSGNGSGVPRPASAASSRHGSSKSVDAGTLKKPSMIRPPSRQQPPRTRAAAAKENAMNGKTEPDPEVTLKSTNKFPSHKRPSNFEVADLQSRKNSMTLEISKITSGLAALSLVPQPVKRTRQSGSPQKKKGSTKKASYMSPCKMLPPKTPKRTPVITGGYMTIESNTPFPPAFDIDTKMTDVTDMIKSMKDSMGSAITDRSVLIQTIDLYKTKISELETSRTLLEDTNAALQRDIDTTRSALSTSTFEADNARRTYLNEVDDMRRKHMDELDTARRGYRDELDDLRRENQRAREESSSSAREGIEQLEKRHQIELQDLKRELSWTLEEEQRARKQDVQSLQDEAKAAQRNAVDGKERHLRDLQDKDSRIEQLSKLLERERDLIDDLRRQLARSNEQNSELENANRNLKAQVEFLKSDSQSQSQAFADLEQQTQNALIQTEDYKTQLRKEESLRRKLLNQIQDLKGNIRVFCRVRPPLASEHSSCAQITFPDAESDSRAVEILGLEEKSSLGKITTKTHAFNFDHSFGPSSQNADIFAELSELVAAVCGGSFNTCIFSYGQTGSGKTYTMASPDGMIARAVDQIFDTAKDLVEKGWRYTISGSFVEVYNENISDLLGRPEDFDKKKHEIRHNAQTLTTEITDVSDVELESSEHFTTVLEQALRNRSIAATKANERSSRSHSVCILKLSGENHMTGETCRSTLNLVDLAGSERLAHSQATGNRLRETQNINKSLSCLADVIAALGEARDGSHIPYRNSKLTYLLQNSLGGNSKTLMFVMISPLQEHLSETLSSLNFATKVNNTRIVRKQKR